MDMKEAISLDARMSAVADSVSRDSVVADVGCDHGYVAIKLVMSGRSKRVIASDVNRGPLETAVANAKKYSVYDKISFVLSDGLDAIDCEKEAVTDIVIAGMGGELTWSIISRCDYIKKARVRLILQPMSAQDILRCALAENGFSILNDGLVKDGERIYQLIVAQYDGITRNITSAEALLGKYPKSSGNEFFPELARRKLAELNKKRSGLLLGGRDASAEESLILQIDQMLEGGKNDDT